MHLFKTSTAKSAVKLKCVAYFLALRSHKTLEKHRVSRLFYLFANLHLLSADSFSSIFFLLSFPSLTLASFVASSVHIVESLTSKLPSTIVALVTNPYTLPVKIDPSKQEVGR